MYHFPEIIVSGKVFPQLELVLRTSVATVAD